MFKYMLESMFQGVIEAVDVFLDRIKEAADEIFGTQFKD